MKKVVFKEIFLYITINIISIVLYIISLGLSYTVFRNVGDIKLLCRVISRGILCLLIIYNSLYLLFTPKWSFLCLKCSPKRRLIVGIVLGFAGLMGLVTAILGYGINGDPTFIWWG